MNMGIYEKIFWARVEGDDELADRLYTKAKKEAGSLTTFLVGLVNTMETTSSAEDSLLQRVPRHKKGDE